MGEVYLGDDLISNESVAIKLIAISDKEEEELLTREVKISHQLTGKNIVKTIYSGKIKINEVDYIYIAQEYFENGNLRKKMQNGIDFDECLSIMKSILNGMNEAHTIIIHRDLKPENILISKTNNIAIADFGLAKLINEKTRTRSFKGSGTIPYMAPECWLNDNNSVAMDIYSLGILFYELLTGELPIDAKTENEWRDFHIYQQLPDPSKIQPKIPTKIKQIISKMTQKRVGDRYKNVQEIIIALNDAIEQGSNERKEFERLASIGHTTIQQIQEEELKRQQELERINTYKKTLNFHITEIFDEIKKISQNVNEHLETQKISIHETPYDSDLRRRTLSINFNSKRVSFNFPEWDKISKYEQEKIIRNRENQMKLYGMILSGPEESIYKKNSIIYFGKLESNYRNPILNECFGFNLILVKDENSLYGKWFLASFSDCGFSQNNRKSFALDFDEFLKNFELSFIGHTMSVIYRELQSSDLALAIEEILK